jgi:hypothetical protein
MQKNPKVWPNCCISSPGHALDQAPRAKKSSVLTRFWSFWVDIIAKMAF